MIQTGESVKRCSKSRVAALVVGALFTAFSPRVAADEPLSAPATYTISSGSKQCFAVSDSKRRITTALTAAPDGKNVELWTVPGWYRVAALSSDCEYLVTGYEGMNLIPADFDRGLVMLTFYRGGKLVRQIRLDQLVRDLSKLRRTVSHFYWGNYLGVKDGYLYRLETVDRGQLFFDMRTGLETNPPGRTDGGRNETDK